MKIQKLRKLLVSGLTVGMLTMVASNVGAMENLVKSVVDGCKTELEKYCKEVTPGKGRVLSCLYAYEDKLSGRCEYALYDAAAQLERAVGALTYVANECEDDLQKHCADIKPGGGRLATCLKKNEKQLTERCQQAMKDINLEAK